MLAKINGYFKKRNLVDFLVIALGLIAFFYLACVGMQIGVMRN